jgi:DNA repair protein RecO (recombination protein O)
MTALIVDINSLPHFSDEEKSAVHIDEAGPSIVSAASSTISMNAPRAAPRRARSFEKDTRIADQPGFVLHSYPYKETSLIVDVFSRDHGRIALVAKGAKRPHSKLRGVLQTFQPLSVGWSGKAEVRTLTAAEYR